ncbi:hypothetical protein AAC387_Pa06g1699 [Persea americana]
MEVWLLLLAMKVWLDFSTEEVEVFREECKVGAPGNPEVGNFESSRNLKKAKSGADELGQPRSLRNEHKESPFVSPWPAVVNFFRGLGPCLSLGQVRGPGST